MHSGLNSRDIGPDPSRRQVEIDLIAGIAFPASAPRPAGGDRNARENEGEPRGAKRTETILVVEDDDDVRSIVEELLADNGYAVLSARNGHEAIQHLKSSETIDLLFTDVVMPGGMNGPDVASAAGQIRPGLKVLFTSGYLGHALVGGGRAALGPSPFLAKPYRPAKLVDVIKGLLDT